MDKRITGCFFTFRYPICSLQTFQRALTQIYIDGVKKDSIPTKDLKELTDICQEIKLSNFMGRNGNVSLFELIAISSIVAALQPQVLVEIGTFDGNTTLQMGLNSPLDANIHTIDLPSSKIETSLPVLNKEVSYIQDTTKQHRK